MFQISRSQHSQHHSHSNAIVATKRCAFCSHKIAIEKAQETLWSLPNRQFLSK
jgi:hypothetical protein